MNAMTMGVRMARISQGRTSSSDPKEGKLTRIPAKSSESIRLRKIAEALAVLTVCHQADVAIFFQGNEPWGILERNAQIKELTIKNYSLRLRSLRQSLSLLYSAVPVMIAIKATSTKAWQSYMTTPQKYTKQSGERAPLLTDQQDIERVLSDYEQTIEELLTKIKDIREECLYQERFQEDDTGRKIYNEVKRLNRQLSELQEALQQEQRPETTTNQTQTENEGQAHMEGDAIHEDEQVHMEGDAIHEDEQVHMEGDAVHEDEQEKIMENVEYMEVVNEDLEDYPPPQDDAIIKALEAELSTVYERLKRLSKEKTCFPRRYETGVNRAGEVTMKDDACVTPKAIISRSEAIQPVVDR
nr:unnamed protein product [Haemonchus contortus]